MVRTAFACALIPIAFALVLVGLRPPQPQNASSAAAPTDEPLVVRAVKTDRYRALPEELLDKDNPLREQSAVPAAVAGSRSQPVRDVLNRADTVATLPPKAKIIPARLDLCARHGLQKVSYTKPNGWKYWRCQR